MGARRVLSGFELENLKARLYAALLQRRRPWMVEGEQVNEWTLLRFGPGYGRHKAARGGATEAHWFCRCSCGVEKWVRATNILEGDSKSCGHTRAGKQQL